MNSANPKKRTCILITGMHRSGTSALAGTLGMLGVGMARRLVPAHASNQKGHFEPTGIVEENDRAFAQEGLSWYHCADPALTDDAALERHAEAILKVVSDDFEDHQTIVIKDPRAARLGRLWHRVATLGDWDMRCIVAHRSASAVVDSLARRNHWAPVRSTWLWLAYMAGAERLTRGYPRVFVDADAFIDQPVETLLGIGDRLGYAWPVDPETAREQINGFLERGLLAQATAMDLPWADTVADTEHALASLTQDATDSSALSVLRAVSETVREVGPGLEPACRAAENYFGSYADAVRRIAETEQRVSQVSAELGEARSEAQVLRAQVTEARTETKLQRLQFEAQDAHLRHTANWLAEKAAKAERRPLRTMLRRLGYGVAKAISKTPGVADTSFGRGATKMVEKHSPKRFQRRIETDAEKLRLPEDQQSLASAERKAVAVDQKRYVACTPEAAPELTEATVVAFYLPQYHPIPENNLWWGEGFTEWVNVTRAVPQFEDQYQPHRPGELGYYDLRIPAVQERQAELARLYGVGAFCYYFYWFAGKTLLEEPLRAMLANPRVDIPFCLCWANENWTRTWDGCETDVLIAQEHGPEDDLAFIAHVADYLRDPRYLRVDGAPVLIVYRPNLLPNMQETAERWRTWCRENGIGEIHLCMTQSFEKTDPNAYGLDASIEFPPNNTAPPDITDRLQPLDPDFAGTVYDWTVFPERAAHYEPPAFPTYRGVCTSWDNTARRGNTGVWFRGATPDGLRDWLGYAIRDTVERVADPSERLVFVNAWNEWAEGAHLEPDQAYGYAWLQAVRDAHELALGPGRNSPLAEPAVLVVHDAHRHGAQMLSYALSSHFKKHFGTALHVVLLSGGEMEDEFARIATVHRIDPNLDFEEEAQRIVDSLAAIGVGYAIVNSVASGRITGAFRKAGFHITTLVHEMPKLIVQAGLQDAVEHIAANSDRVVFPSQIVRQGFEGIAALPEERAIIRPQGMYKPPAPRDPETRARWRAKTRDEMGLNDKSFLVVGVGFGDHRKGIDLFLQTAIEICRSDPDAVFIWAGKLHQDHRESLPAEAAEAGLSNRIRFPGFMDDMTGFFLAADLFLLSSREDPFPSVTLEAMDAGVPVVAIAGTGGCADLVASGHGRIAATASAADLATQVRALRDAKDRAGLAQSGRDLVSREFSFGRYAFDILSVDGTRAPRVSVIVPSYNYIKFIEERLRSIAAQTWPIYELIVLDDASQDGTAEWLEKHLEEICPGATLVLSQENSGSVFRQWHRGLEMARGDLVWIAEADDSCEPTMLERLVDRIDTPDVCMAYCQSTGIDDDGNLVLADYTTYTADIDPSGWEASFVEDGQTALANHFAIKNVVPNVSAVLFRRESLLRALADSAFDLGDWKVAGDWRIYASVLAEGGKISFEADALNIHRRHGSSVTGELNLTRHLKEIENMQKFIADTVDVPEDVARTAAAYRERIRQQFNL